MDLAWAAVPDQTASVGRDVYGGDALGSGLVWRLKRDGKPKCRYIVG